MNIPKVFQSLFDKKNNYRKSARDFGIIEDAEKEALLNRISYLENLVEEKTIMLEKAKSIFLKNINHEIRTPLNAIVGFSELIGNDLSKDENFDKFIGYIRQSSAEFLWKMDEIIEASMLEAGIFSYKETECFPFYLMQDIYSEFSVQKHIFEKESVAFLMTVASELREVKILCDMNRVGQILKNLLSNAFKFTTHGVVEFGYKIIKDRIEFFVKDSGLGGLKGKEDVVYASFRKVDESDNAISGLGLGLYLSYKIAERIGGNIRYEPNNLKGTTFYFSLPLKYAKVEKELVDQDSNREVKKITFAKNKSVAL